MKTADNPAEGLLLSRCVLGDALTVPPVVASWMLENTKLPDEHQARVRELYEKQMAEDIDESELSELDHYSEIIAAIDILRAKAKTSLLRAA
jgi:hypothetical protein